MNLVVIHTTECDGPCSLATLTDPEGGASGPVSSHYLVVEDGTVYQLVNESDEAWTQGSAYNPESIGIEVAGRADSPATWTPAAVRSLGNLVGYLSQEYDLPLVWRPSAAHPESARGYVAHAALAPRRKTDPGPWFDWPQVKAQAERYTGGRMPGGSPWSSLVEPPRQVPPDTGAILARRRERERQSRSRSPSGGDSEGPGGGSLWLVLAAVAAVALWRA